VGRNSAASPSWRQSTLRQRHGRRACISSTPLAGEGRRILSRKTHRALVEDVKDFRADSQFTAEIHIRPYGEVSGEREVLIDGLDPLLSSLCGRREIGRLPSELDRPGVRREHTADDLIRVDLPAPLSPTNPVISPVGR
jgi:hypothetical protein